MIFQKYNFELQYELKSFDNICLSDVDEKEKIMFYQKHPQNQYNLYAVK